MFELLQQWPPSTVHLCCTSSLASGVVVTFAALCESLAQSFASGVWLESVSSELGHFDVMVVVNLDVDKFSNTIGIAKLKISLTAKLPAIKCIFL